jgi:hypothetical protein
MKHIKYYENFLDRIESMVKGKSEKGKIVEDLLKKNNMKLEGFGYAFRYMGGPLSDNKEINSHPISYLVNREDNKDKLKLENDKLILSEDLKEKKVINIIPMIDKEEKDGVLEHGRIWSSCVIKFDYKFDLTQENPTLTLSDALLYNIETGKFEQNELATSMNKVEVIDGDINTESVEESDINQFIGGVIFNQNLEITYQQFIDEVNKRKDIIDIISKHSSGLNKKETATVERLQTKFNKF